MFFRHLTMFRFAPALLDLATLQQDLEHFPLKPVGASEFESVGFVSPLGRGSDVLVHQVGNAAWFTLGSEERILPLAVINAELGKRVAELEEREGRRLGGKARKRLKEDVVMELLPRAFVRPGRLNAYIDADLGVLFVDTSSKRAAEFMVGELRVAMGSFPALPLNAETSARALLTGWLAGEPLPGKLVLADACQLEDPVDGGAAARISRSELQADEVLKHLEAGKQCTRLALVHDDHVLFTLDEDLTLRGVKFLDGAVESLENTERDSIAAELDARFALMSGELRRLFEVLEPALKLSRVEG